MIQLNDGLKIGRGNKRICFQHPGDPHKCIKVNRPEKADCPATDEEAAYFKKLSRLKPDLDYSGVCRFMDSWKRTWDGAVSSNWSGTRTPGRFPGPWSIN